MDLGLLEGREIGLRVVGLGWCRMFLSVSSCGGF